MRTSNEEIPEPVHIPQTDIRNEEIPEPVHIPQTDIRMRRHAASTQGLGKVGGMVVSTATGVGASVGEGLEKLPGAQVQ